MEKIIFCGDVHMKIDKFAQITQKHRDQTIIQVGDFGFRNQHEWFLENMDTTKHKVLFGNHDYYPYLHREHSLGDFGLYDGHIFFIRGAHSTDAHHRTEGFDWFQNEELDYMQGREAIDMYEKIKPPIVVSHDCPNVVAHVLHGRYLGSTITRQLLDVMFEIHEPEMWIFGHHHRSFDRVIGNTTFKCLAELEIFEF